MMFNRITALVALTVTVGVAVWSWSHWNQGASGGDRQSSRVDGSATMDAGYVGAQRCAECHRPQAKAWEGSHHALAMQHAGASTVLGDFNRASYTHGAVTTTFFMRDGRYFANTDGPDGQLRDFEVRYTFGVYPLQQYLIGFPDGRLQALGIAWDSRPREEGGQRWFHLYPAEHIDHTDELHWTKLAQNWNHMCAECHSTNVRKRFSVADNRFDTTYAEINVACESCHGPGSRHVAWARREPGATDGADKGLVIRLDERMGVRWQLVDGARIATRSAPRAGVKEIEMCARCHSRRSQLAEDYHHGRALMDTHLPALLNAPHYFPDGQIRDEDFEYGSFLQSRMFHAGVTCGDCHDPHSQALRAPGNGTCLQCHRASAYDTPSHHFHRAEGKGGQCVSCHMPTTNFMVVHARHDHSIRIPRPDLSVKIGTPNACNQCHADRAPAWAVAQLERWYGKDWSPGWHFGETLHDGAIGVPQAGTDLAAVSLSPQVPDIARATAASMLTGYLEPTTLAVLPRLLADPSDMVRHAALGIVEALPPERRWAFAGALLSDAVLAVRIEAARVLAAVASLAPGPDRRAALDAGVREYVAASMASAEHPQSHVNLGLLYLALGEPDKAEKAYRQALAIDSTYVPAWVNLADLWRNSHQDAKVESTLLQARAACGSRAAIEHALGLHYVRSRQLPEAITALTEANRLEPDNARYGYVLGVALDAAGETDRALTVLDAVHATHPRHGDVLVALVSFNLALGHQEAARRYAAALAALDARYGSVDQVIASLSPR